MSEKRTQYAEAKLYRTKSWQSQPEYDNTLADLDISSLKFLKFHYVKEIREFTLFFDLNNPKNFNLFKEMKQRYKMINEELDNRTNDIYASPTYQFGREHFDAETGLVLDEYNNIQYSIAYTDDEEDIVYNHTNNSTGDVTIESSDDETDYEMYKSDKLIDIYRNWNYYEDLNE